MSPRATPVFKFEISMTEADSDPEPHAQGGSNDPLRPSPPVICLYDDSPNYTGDFLVGFGWLRLEISKSRLNVKA